jgi:hypothetical protein
MGRLRHMCLSKWRGVKRVEVQGATRPSGKEEAAGLLSRAQGASV